MSELTIQLDEGGTAVVRVNASKGDSSTQLMRLELSPEGMTIWPTRAKQSAGSMKWADLPLLCELALRLDALTKIVALAQTISIPTVPKPTNGHTPPADATQEVDDARK